jgi:hypothetical protein
MCVKASEPEGLFGLIALRKLIFTLITLPLSYPIVIADWYVSSFLRAADIRRVIKENKEIF